MVSRAVEVEIETLLHLGSPVFGVLVGVVALPSGSTPGILQQ